jgi:glycosyltransferase involved in cell wall biosynthesis
MSSQPRKRILHVYQSPSYSGAEAYARDVALWHAKNHHGVVFLAKCDSPLSKKLHIDQAELKGLDFRVETDASHLDFQLFDAIVLHSTRELKNLWPHLLWARIRSWFSKGSGTGKPFGKFAPCTVLYSHIWISHSKRDPIHYFLYKLIDQFWGSSLASKKNLEKQLPMSPEKIRLIRYGRDIDGFEKALKTKSAARDLLNIPQDAKVFGTLARVDQGKGSRELFDAAIQLLSENAALYFLMIGPPTASDPKAVALDRQLETELQNLESTNPKVFSRIHKIGRLEDGSSYLSAFDLFVLATYKENFALTLLEAQLASVPCLATNSGGSPDLVIPGKTGWLFEPASAASLEAAIRLALAEESTWSDVIVNSKAQVRQAYRFDRVLEELDRHLGI